MRNFQKNQVFEGQVVDLTSQGEGVVKIDHFPFFVAGVIPGEKIRFKIILLKKNFGIGKMEAILEASPDRVELIDEIGQQIGTMTLQHLNYDSQLVYKKGLVEAAFERIGKFTKLAIQDTIGMENPWAYRNKAQIPVREQAGQLQTGFFRRNSHDLVAVENFHIQDPEIDRIIIQVRDILRKYKVPAYDEVSHSGLIRHIIVKRGHYTGQVMIVLVTNDQDLPHETQIVQDIALQVDGLVSLIQNIHTERTNVILGGPLKILWGQDYYEDQLLGMTFRISAKSFFQVNTSQTERLYQTAIEACDLKGHELVVDAYCGIGSISLSLAKKAQHVYGMEIVPEAVEMAKINAFVNQIDNVTFETGSAKNWLGRWQHQGLNFDVVLVDPPRKGLEDEFVNTLIELNPPKIVYVSCNPATQARDVRKLANAGYEIQLVQPVDLFPQTVHVESIVLIEKEWL